MYEAIDTLRTPSDGVIDGGLRRGMVAVAEPTYPNAEHATVNGVFLQALQRVCGPVVFASTAVQHGAVMEADPRAPRIAWDQIPVLPPGGVHLRRIRAQWDAMNALVLRHRSPALVLLSAGPETLFVARALVARHPRLRGYVVMHGNLAEVAGWRSRDPRRRMIDLRSGLAVARHKRIRLVVLDDYIKRAAERLVPGQDFLVWPIPVVAAERAPMLEWHAPDRLGLTFVGTANRGKGFDDYLALYREAGPSYRWSVAGRLGNEFGPGDVGDIPFFTGYSSRDVFLSEVRRADYAVLAFRPAYALTTSASLLDCVTQRKPVIAVANDMLRRLAGDHGPIGYLCPTLEAMQELIATPERLRDEAAYAQFQRGLDSIYHSRGFGQLTVTIQRDLVS